MRAGSEHLATYRTGSGSGETVDTTTTNSSYEGDSSRVIEENLVGLERKTYAYDAFGEALSLSSKPNSQAPVEHYSYLYDPGSSVSLLVDSTGAVKESYGYTAYGSDNGAISKKAAGFSAGKVPTNPVRFQGKRFDSGSGSYDMGRDATPPRPAAGCSRTSTQTPSTTWASRRIR